MTTPIIAKNNISEAMPIKPNDSMDTGKDQCKGIRPKTTDDLLTQKVNKSLVKRSLSANNLGVTTQPLKAEKSSKTMWEIARGMTFAVAVIATGWAIGSVITVPKSCEPLQTAYDQCGQNRAKTQIMLNDLSQAASTLIKHSGVAIDSMATTFPPLTPCWRYELDYCLNSSSIPAILTAVACTALAIYCASKARRNAST